MATRFVRKINAAQSRLTVNDAPGGRRNDNIRTAVRGMSLSYSGGDRGGRGGSVLNGRQSMGGRHGEGTKANRAYRAAAIRVMRAGGTIAQANRAGYRAGRGAMGMAGG